MSLGPSPPVCDEAFQAGLAPGMKLVSINGHAYGTQVLRDAIAKAQQDKQPLQIRAQADGGAATYAVRYDGGLKYPHLIRVQGKTDYLREVLAPKPLDAGP